MIIAYAILLGHVAAAILIGWWYFRRFAITRPPLGVFNLWDITMMMAGIVLVPYLYLILPSWSVAGLLALGTPSVLYIVWEPVLRARWAIWLAALALVGLDIGAALWLGPASSTFWAINNVVLVVAIVGITNLWAQSGMHARDVAILAGVLAVYDAIVTWQLNQTADLFDRLFGLPLAPLMVWPLGDGRWLGIGMGDTLLATVLPLVLRKAFGRTAGAIALATNILVIAVVLFAPWLSAGRGAFPVMVLLAPLSVLHYLYWRWRVGLERSTWQYQQAEPRGPTALPILDRR